MTESLLVTRLEEKSKSLDTYVNNLDLLLGIQTFNAARTIFTGLKLNGNILNIDSDWNWYLVDKHPTQDVFKVVGLPKNSKNPSSLVYILGKHKKPFLLKIDSKYVDNSSVETCLKSVEVSLDLSFLKPTLWIVGTLGVLGAAGWFIVKPIIEALTTAVNSVPTSVISTTTNSNSSGLNAIVNVLLIVFVVFILLSAVRLMDRD